MLRGFFVSGACSVTLDCSRSEPLAVGHSAWIAARAVGPWSRMVLNDIQAFAHTSPVYMVVGAEKNTRGRFATAERKQEVVELFRRARGVYAGFEARPR